MATNEHIRAAYHMTADDDRGSDRAMGRNREGRMRAVLLVDSAEDNRAMYAEFLRVNGFRTIEVDNTRDALALAVTVDAVVTGIRLPGPFDGVELVRRLRADDRTQSKPVIVLTGCAFHEDERRARAAGGDVFLAKPCLPDTLVTELRRVLAEQHSRDVA